MGFFDVGLFWIYSAAWVTLIGGTAFTIYWVLGICLKDDPVHWLLNKIYWPNQK